MFTVYHLNFGTAYSFDTYEAAKDFAVKQCFESAIYYRGMICGSFSPISGYRSAAGWHTKRVPGSVEYLPAGSGYAWED